MIAEARIQSLIIARLNAIPNVLVWRQNTGAIKTATGFVRFGVPGQADISGLILTPQGVGVRLEVEVKSDTGRPSAAQIAFGERIAAHGGLYILAHELDDALVPVVRALGHVPGVCSYNHCWCWQPSVASNGRCEYHLGRGEME